MENKTYAERLLELRRKSGMNAQDFAAHFGVTYNTYCQWESGRRVPSSHVISMMEHIVELEEVMNDRIKLTKRIETLDYYQKVLAQAGLYCPNDADVVKFERSGNLETIQKGDTTYYTFKDDRGYQLYYEPCFDKFVEKEQIENHTS